MHLTYGYDLKEGDSIVIPPMRNAELTKQFVLPGGALVNHLPFRAVLLISYCHFDSLTAFPSPTPPFVGSLVQVRTNG